ncbi:alpha/beta fold hydrolase [Aeromonas cavernicola]|uniref:Alpha/beta hydrolase n=1 Tax=Aeromonas cavernicola TaxID=1006623 RepID=A0A2H9U9F8_9GAMM|nr:alpha/beta hydrolase [Aeromonas cavernicola]PJG60652.1 alpha/beta hydrolase [Aeromonas cavernicola]
MSDLVSRLARFPLQHLTLGGRQLAYRRAGEGPVLLLLHGISSGSGSWLNQLEQLAAHFTLVAWDMPGYGQSDPLPTATPTAQSYAEVLHQLITALELAPPLLVGHSLGAMVASAYGRLHPAQIRGLVLANPAQGYGRAEPATREQVYRQRPQMLRALGAAGLAATRGPVLLAPHATPAQLALVANSMMGLTQRGFEAASYLLANDEIRDYLAGYRAPIGVIDGEQDVITPAEGIRALAAAHGNHYCHSLPAAGHASYIDQPAAFNRAVIQLAAQLSEHRGPHASVS